MTVPGIAHGRSAPSALALATAGVVAAGAGVAVIHVGGELSLATTIVLAAASALWIMRHSRPVVPTVAAVATDEARAPFAAARIAFLAGLVFSAQLVLRPALGLTASDLAFLASVALAVVLLSFSLGGYTGSLPPGVLVGSALFLSGACVSAFAAEAPMAAFAAPARFLFLIVVWFWAATLVLPRARDVHAAVACWVLSVAISGAAAVAQLFLGNVVPNTAVDWGRMTGTAQHVNDLGGSAAVALPAAAALALAPGLSRLPRQLGTAAALLVVAGLVLSGSVGSMLAAAAGLAVAAVAAQRKAAFAAASAGVAAVALVVSWFQAAELSTALPERLDVVTSPTGTFAARLDVFQQALVPISDSPLVGVGFGFDPRVPGSELTDLIHNALLSVLYQGGLLALLGLCVICWVGLRTGVRAVTGACSDDERLLGAALLGSFVAYLVFGLGEPTLYSRYGWIPVALLIALVVVQERRDSERWGET